MKSSGTNLLIIGYGNPLRGDDGIGWRVADQLAALTGDAATVLTVHQLTPELAEPISKADLVIFVDACYAGQPGSWTCETIRPDQESPAAFTHYFGPANLLGYAKAIFDAKPSALLISVAGASFDCGDQLSPAVAGIIPEIVATVSQWWGAAGLVTIKSRIGATRILDMLSGEQLPRIC
jgi:hydrogenase maturation protease